jgi:uncharacterized protein (DUF983 family)
VKFADRCGGCGIDYSGFNVGDGPAALLIIPLSALIIIGAIMMDIAIRPPFWVHVIIWIPLTIILTISGLRAAKGALLALEYRNRAGAASTVAPKEPGI